MIRRNSRKNKCTTKHCRGNKALRPNGRVRDGKCWKCRSRLWRENQPCRAAYINLKSHAKEREIPFSISFGYFKRFAEKSELIENMGRTAQSLTVDRWKNTRGYVYNNLRVMTRSANSIKAARYDEIRTRTGFAWKAEYRRRAA